MKYFVLVSGNGQVGIWDGDLWIPIKDYDEWIDLYNEGRSKEYVDDSVEWCRSHFDTPFWSDKKWESVDENSMKRLWLEANL